METRIHFLFHGCYQTYVYHKFEGFEQENNFVKYFQNPELSHSTPRSSKHNPDGLLTNYFVIQNNINANTKGAI